MSDWQAEGEKSIYIKTGSVDGGFLLFCHFFPCALPTYLNLHGLQWQAKEQFSLKSIQSLTSLPKPQISLQMSLQTTGMLKFFTECFPIGQQRYIWLLMIWPTIRWSDKDAARHLGEGEDQVKHHLSSIQDPLPAPLSLNKESRLQMPLSLRIETTVQTFHSQRPIQSQYDEFTM